MLLPGLTGTGRSNNTKKMGWRGALAIILLVCARGGSLLIGAGCEKAHRHLMLVRGTHVARDRAGAQALHPLKEVFLKFAIDLWGPVDWLSTPATGLK